MTTVSSRHEAIGIIGPIEEERGACGRIIGSVLTWGALVAFGPALCATQLLIVPWPPQVPLGLPSLLPGIWLVLMLGVFVWVWWRLRWWLLIGQRGFALWQPGEAICVRWDELGTAWRESFELPRSSADTEPFALVHPDGTRVVINTYFDRHHLLVRRILRHLRDHQEGRDATAPKNRSSQQIKPTEWNVREPRPE